MRADIVLIGLLSIPFSVGTSYAREALVLSGARRRPEIASGSRNTNLCLQGHLVWRKAYQAIHSQW